MSPEHPQPITHNSKLVPDHTIAQLARSAGFTGQALVWATAIALAESAGDPAAAGTNPPTDGCPSGSIDRGLWQINSCWHPEWTDAQCYDPSTCAQAAYAISSHGTDFTPWSTFQNGQAAAMLPRARIAAGAAPPIFPPSAQLTPWTPVAQLRTWAPDETYAAERTEGCAQAAILMCLKWASGIWTPAAYLHDLVHDQGQITATTFDQIIQTLSIMETRATLHYPDGLPATKQLIQQSINAQHPLIPLRSFGYPGNPVLHFTVVTGYTPDMVQQAFPWDGIMVAETWDRFMAMYIGGILVVHRKRMLGDQ